MIDQQGVTQSELAQELGAQGVVLKILRGTHEMNLRRTRALAIRVSVPVTAFMGSAGVAVRMT